MLRIDSRFAALFLALGISAAATVVGRTLSPELPAKAAHEDDSEARSAEIVTDEGLLLGCGPATDAVPLVAAEDVPYGCGFLDGTGAKLAMQPPITAIVVTYADGASEQAAIHAEPAGARHQVAFGVPPARASFGFRIELTYVAPRSGETAISLSLPARSRLARAKSAGQGTK